MEITESEIDLELNHVELNANFEDAEKNKLARDMFDSLIDTNSGQ